MRSPPRDSDGQLEFECFGEMVTVLLFYRSSFNFYVRFIIFANTKWLKDG